jgi:hypothetical protein
MREGVLASRQKVPAHSGNRAKRGEIVGGLVAYVRRPEYRMGNRLHDDGDALWSAGTGRAAGALDPRDVLASRRMRQIPQPRT